MPSQISHPSALRCLKLVCWCVCLCICVCVCLSSIISKLNVWEFPIISKLNVWEFFFMALKAKILQLMPLQAKILQYPLNAKILLQWLLYEPNWKKNWAVSSVVLLHRKFWVSSWLFRMFTCSLYDAVIVLWVHLVLLCELGAAHCNTLQHIATHCNTLQHTATHCSTLQHTATHCNTLQHITCGFHDPVVALSIHLESILIKSAR